MVFKTVIHVTFHIATYIISTILLFLIKVIFFLFLLKIIRTTYKSDPHTIYKDFFFLVTIYKDIVMPFTDVENCEMFWFIMW